MPSISAPSVFTPREIARVAGVPVQLALAELGCADGTGVLVPRAEAVQVVRRLRREARRTVPASPRLFMQAASLSRRRGMPLAASATAHGVLLAVVVIVASLGVSTNATPAAQTAIRLEPLRMVYLAIPGPGGGGGGGGMREATPAPRAQRQGAAKVSSPVPQRRQAPVEPVLKPADPPPLQSEPLPPILAPVVAVPSDSQNRVGVIDAAPADRDSAGPGTGGGAGSGKGTGMGEGDGSGIGPGSGGGTGGGPYRPGSGVEPPTILHEVKPTYTETARLRGVTGEVVLEIVVLRNGSVGNIRVLHGLGSGLDERAAEAVRQWRFAPARRLGQPVDVMVEVAVEFRLR